MYQLINLQLIFILIFNKYIFNFSSFFTINFSIFKYLNSKKIYPPKITTVK